MWKWKGTEKAKWKITENSLAGWVGTVYSLWFAALHFLE